MYEVVIIDDEPVIVEGLAKTLSWEKWNCRVSGTAYDGKEGMMLIRKTRPDIVITDICMPCMNGLVMIAALRSEYPQMQVTILTGYRDFNYAQEAIKLGVTRFICKPSKMGELEDAMAAMTGCLEKAGVLPDHKSDEYRNVDEDDDEIIGVSSAGNFIVRNALEYVHEHYSERLRLSDVADQIYVSQWHLSKLLNKQTGQNFSEILNGIRIEKAKELMIDPSLRISDIAEQVGFLDVAHFSRVFKKSEGISANEYRNKI